MNKRGMAFVFAIFIGLVILVIAVTSSTNPNLNLIGLSLSPDEEIPPGTGAPTCLPGYTLVPGTGWCCRPNGNGEYCYNGNLEEPNGDSCKAAGFACNNEGFFRSGKQIHTFSCDECVSEHCQSGETKKDYVVYERKTEWGCRCTNGVWVPERICDWVRNGQCVNSGLERCLDCDGNVWTTKQLKRVGYTIDEQPVGCVPFDSPVGCPDDGPGQAIPDRDVPDLTCEDEDLV